jgi:hypothetical protein
MATRAAARLSMREVTRRSNLPAPARNSDQLELSFLRDWPVEFWEWVMVGLVEKAAEVIDEEEAFV